MPTVVFSRMHQTICHIVRVALAHPPCVPPTLRQAALPHTPFPTSWLLIRTSLLHNLNPVSWCRLQRQREVGRLAALIGRGWKEKGGRPKKLMRCERTRRQLCMV